jgi:hypothetical protein
VADRRKGGFNNVGRAQVFPVFGWEVLEGKQRIAIRGQALDRFVVFDVPGLNESIECGERILLGLGHPDLLQCPLRFRLLALRQLAPELAIADGGLGFWQAVEEVWPTTRGQRCWVA